MWTGATVSSLQKTINCALKVAHGFRRIKLVYEYQIKHVNVS